jgi:deazaflavin-dependent oxidoreductase (nitroreductase family)
VKRRILRAFWRVVNPLATPLAGIAPWWVLIETTGNRTGQRRTTPLATGPIVDGAMLLIAVHGHTSGWIRNIAAQQAVRLKHGRRWRDATASIESFDRQLARQFNLYARMGPPLTGIDPVIVRIRFR